MLISDSVIMKEALRILCCNNGWCYGVLWAFHHTKTLLLTLKDAYYSDEQQQMGALIHTMLSQVHVLGGGGVIGQVAFTHGHHWIHSDSYEDFELFQEEAEFYTQFSMGMKTIALISVEPWGVVQFGSTQKNPETKGFVDRVRSLFREVGFIEDAQILDPATRFTSQLGSMEANDDDHHPTFISTSTDQVDDCYLLNPSEVFDCEDTQNLTLLTADCKAQHSSGLLTMEELFQENDPGDEFSRWFLPQSSLDPNATTTTDLSHSTGLIPLSCLSVNNSPIHMSETNSTQSSFTLGSYNPGTSKRALTWDETLVPVGAPSRTSLFSKLGLDQILDSGQSSKRRKTDSCQSSLNQAKSEGGLFSFDGKIKSLEIPEFEPKREDYIGESCFVDGGNTSSSERQEETARTEKKKNKKAKAGTKPRPKDRQMIQDRLGELRKLIPNAEKMSIDRLLEQTIRHLNFMQSLVKHAKCLKEIHKSKSRDIPKNGDGGGVTWACNIGDESVGCPLVVEDLVTPGQMLIEMLCDELGFFLEISDVIRGFGLIILKGVMEVRETKKIRAHFLVQAEGTRRVTRHDVFSSLIRFLQMTGQSTASANVIMPSTNNCQPEVQIPVDTLQCANF